MASALKGNRVWQWTGVRSVEEVGVVGRGGLERKEMEPGGREDWRLGERGGERRGEAQRQEERWMKEEEWWERKMKEQE